jgi:cytochrome c biogenesis protein ResB
MRRLILRSLGSLPMAVVSLLAIGAVLGWGTLYEARFGTTAAQRFVYGSWWFQALLSFLGVNLAVAALERRPWQRRHLPFLLAHLGIILILCGGILGGRLGIEGQLIIPEGQAQRLLRLPQKVLTIEDVQGQAAVQVPTAFDARAWVDAQTKTGRV